MLHFQVAGSPGGYLLEHLLVESIGAVRGGGIFAWVNSNGARALLEDSVFQEFLKAGNFRLFVGTDSITDVPAVHKLIQLTTNNPRLEVRAFLNPGTELFHPKLSWFEHENHLSLIVGSGNLTMGGLRANWEAFTVQHLQGADAAAALQSIEDFISGRADGLAPISDPRVMEQAGKNSGNERSIRAHPQPIVQQSEVLFSTEEILVAEITKSDNRWSQANFNRENYENFFGAKIGSQRRIILQHVDGHGEIGPVESRPSVEVASQNYRFELAAARGVQYPKEGRPIGVFLRLSTGHFLYTLLLPGDPGYPKVANFLEQEWDGAARNLRRIRCKAEDLHAAWNESAIWSIAMPAL